MNSLSQSHAAAERRAKLFWVTLVVLLLTLQVLIGAAAIYLSTGDRSVAVVPDYHRAALDWDNTKAANTAAQRLGWNLTLAASDVADGRGMRAMEIQISDAEQQPVDALRVNGRIYHHARGGEIETIRFRSIGDGHYLAMAPMARPGLWQVDVNVDGGPERISLSQTLDVSAPKSSTTK